MFIKQEKYDGLMKHEYDEHQMPRGLREKIKMNSYTMNLSADYRCPYGYGLCEVPLKDCPHWQGTFCELDRRAKDVWEPKYEEENNE